MKQNSLDAKKHETSSSSSSLSSDQQLTIVGLDIPVHSYNGRHDDIAYIQREMRDSMIRRESLLDDYCDSLVDVKSAFSNNTSAALTKIKKLELAAPTSVGDGDNFQTKATGHADHYGKSNGNAAGRKPASIDPKKKNTLLAALKHIDNDSIDN